MKNSALLLLLSGLLPVAAHSQQHYLVTFKDKGTQASALLKTPEKYLSERALERRQKAGIGFTEQDLPVSEAYLKQLQTKKVNVLQKSKWLNLALISTELSADQLKAACPAVATIKPVAANKTRNKPGESGNTHALKPAMPIDYGSTTDQIAQLNLNCLHDRGYTGQGVLVAQFDSGWEGVDLLPAYDALRNENRLLATRNFVNPGQTVFGTHNHGTITFSVMAANSPGQFVGGAPQATYALALTEDVSQEVHQEEINWAAAAEWADSLGADIITSSLGYKVFDPGQVDYTSADLNGDIAIVTQAADHAASLGIIVVNSAGNSGASGISAPCDGDSVLCVGAVDITGTIAGFSSVGPTGDGRTKPDIVALGVATQSILPDGTIAGVNGTSLSCPMMASLVTCLRQAYPSLSNMQIINAIKQAGDRSNNPDNEYGWGLPDACEADDLLQALSSGKDLSLQNGFSLSSSLVSQNVTLTSQKNQTGAATIEMYAITGQKVAHAAWPQTALPHEIKTQHLSSGLYILTVQPEHGQPQVFKFVKE